MVPLYSIALLDFLIIHFSIGYLEYFLSFFLKPSRGLWMDFRTSVNLLNTYVIYMFTHIFLGSGSIRFIRFLKGSMTQSVGDETKSQT